MQAPHWPFALDRSHPLARGLVGAFFARSGAQTFVDLHANRNIATNNASGDVTPFARMDGVGYGVKFSGDSTFDRVKLGSVVGNDPLALAGKTTVSILAWIRVDGAGSFPRIIDKSTGGLGANGWCLYLPNAAGKPVFQTGGGSNTHSPPSDIFPAAGTTFLCGYTMETLTVGRFYINGVLASSVSSTLTAIPNATADCAIGNWNISSPIRQFNGAIFSVMVYDRALSAEEHAAAYDPASRWAFLDTYGRKSYFVQASPGGTSGTLAVTQANQTSSASGRLVKRGTAAATEAADTLSAAGSVTHRGTINVTQADHTSVIAGRVIRRGTVAVTEADDTLSAAGGPLAPIGTVDANEDDDTLNASGRLVRRGTMAATQADQTMSAAGRVIRRGTVDVTQADQTLSAAGGPISNIKYGTVDVTQADNTLAAVGRVIRRGDIVVTQSDQAMAAAGRVVHRGTVNVTSQDHWMTATGYPESTPPVPDSGSSIWSFLLATLRRTLYATDRDQQNGDRKP